MAVALPVVLRRFAGLSVPDLARLLAARSFAYAPKLVKYAILFLFLCQARSWPLVWHFYVWRPVFAIRGRYLLHRLSHILSPARVRKQKNLEWLEGLSPVGINPFDVQVTYKTWAGPDECDFNMHLSNSSYPRHLDGARFKYALKFCPTFFRAGGWMALGATHFAFLREIPMFSKYEMRVSVMSWDHKWIYVVTRFVTKPKKGSKRPHAQQRPAKLESASATPPADAAPRPSLHTARDITESSPSTPPNGNDNSSSAALRAAAKQLLERPEPDGAVLNCLSVSEICCKIGRITVPPALVLAMDGLSRAPDGVPAKNANGTGNGKSQAQAYSRANPPPHWEHVRRLRGEHHTIGGAASMRTLRDFYTTGWRNMPEDGRWWEDALGGEVEERRLLGLGSMQALRHGMEEARTI